MAPRTMTAMPLTSTPRTVQCSQRSSPSGTPGRSSSGSVIWAPWALLFLERLRLAVGLALDLPGARQEQHREGRDRLRVISRVVARYGKDRADGEHLGVASCSQVRVGLVVELDQRVDLLAVDLVLLEVVI